MSLKPGLRLSQSQRLTLTPALRQSISVLGMSNSELLDHVEAELAQNPLLLAETSRYSGASGDFDLALDTVAARKTRGENLRDQIALLAANRQTALIAGYLADDLTDEGYLCDDDAELAQTLKIDVSEITKAISLLQRCEPTGIGARNLRECLDLQLCALEQPPQIRELILDNLGLFADSDWAKLQNLSGQSRADLDILNDLLRALNPFPGEDLSPNMAEVLYPDIRITPLPEGGFSIESVNSTLPSLTVNADLMNEKSTANAEATQYFNDRISRAKILIRAIEARSKTILRVGRQIATEQHRFFADGHAHLRPLRQIDVAQSLGLHPSTVARAIANKALECRFGILPLKFFFTPGLKSLTDQQAVSAYVIQQRITRLVHAENPAQILSDAKITAHLQQSGVDIARRTVAKYRQCLKIPSSVQRRKSKKLL
ncbi:MAG: RNA polymerase factor sigma-54 [Alphaproteobacteria bacterium]|nr:RNA polymerase factor sigma-54 [Alphaproteobacteria bacterium]